MLRARRSAPQGFLLTDLRFAVREKLLRGWAHPDFEQTQISMTQQLIEAHNGRYEVQFSQRQPVRRAPTAPFSRAPTPTQLVRRPLYWSCRGGSRELEPGVGARRLAQHVAEDSKDVEELRRVAGRQQLLLKVA